MKLRVVICVIRRKGRVLNDCSLIGKSVGSVHREDMGKPTKMRNECGTGEASGHLDGAELSIRMKRVVKAANPRFEA